jgi:hypothetical protein
MAEKTEMKKMKNIQFFTSRRGGEDGGEISYLMAGRDALRSVITKGERHWKRECFHETSPDVDALHFISFDEDSDSYLLESVVKSGRSYHRHEASMTVDEIKKSSEGDIESIFDVVRAMSKSLEPQESKGFQGELPIRSDVTSSRLEEGDPLNAVRGGASIPEGKRGAIRKLLSLDAVEKKELPEGVLVS